MYKKCRKPHIGAMDEQRSKVKASVTTDIDSDWWKEIDWSNVTVNMTVMSSEPISEKGKACEFCGNVFRSDREDSRYCSTSCRQKAYYQRKKEPDVLDGIGVFGRVRRWISNKLLTLSQKIKP
jgi:hypothetical protein